MSREIKKAFDGIVADEQLKKQTIQYVSKQLNKKTKYHPGYWRQFRVQLAMGLIVILSLTGFFTYQTPVSAVSIDSEYSIELRVNRFNRVVEVIGYDEAGNELSETLSVKHMNYETAMVEILDAMDAEEDQVYVTVASNRDSRAANMMANLENHEALMGHRMEVFQSSNEMMQEARKAGVSVGRMRAMLQLHELEGEVDIDDELTLPTDEMIEAVESHHQEMQNQMNQNNSHKMPMMEKQNRKNKNN